MLEDVRRPQSKDRIDPIARVVQLESVIAELIDGLATTREEDANIPNVIRNPNETAT